MAFIGSIIKGIIELSDKVVSEPDAVETQQEVLKDLLKTTKKRHLVSIINLMKSLSQKILVNRLQQPFLILVTIIHPRLTSHESEMKERGRIFN